MRTAVHDLLDVEFPIFAFSHCRDVVAAVTNAGGMGVLGAVAHTPDELEIDLRWLDEHTSSRPYGVDLLIPSKYAGADAGGIERTDLWAQVPEEHRRWLDELLERYEIPDLPPRDPHAPRRAGLQVDPKSMGPLVDIAFEHDIELIASALGSPPPWLVERAHDRGVRVAALAGTVPHALKHTEVGVDLVIAQGTEAGGHTGEISTLVLVPQVVDAVAPVPVLAAGGIGNGRQVAASLALGAAGVWCGSVWLTTEEAESSPAEVRRFLGATSADTVRTRSLTGKPCRVLTSEWTAAWEEPSAPEPLPMPIQSMLVHRSQERIKRVAGRPDSRAIELLSPFVGQVVGLMGTVKPAGRVVLQMVEEFVEAMERLEASIDG